MRGKLTEQLPEDGTAEDLFQQIQEEKEELAKNGELYREKLISTISPCDIPYSIPKSWIWVRLGELSKVITKGSSPKWQGISYTDADNGILFVTSENIGKGKMIFDKKKYIQKQFNDNHQSSILQKGDILTNIVGASIGRTALFDLDTENANINQAVCIIRLVNAAISEYVLQYLCSERAVNLMLGKVVDTARANLSLTSVSNLLLPLPPLAEQKRIVEKIEQIFSILDAIDALQAKYAGNLSALKAKLIDAAIQGKLTEQLPEDGTAEEHYIRVKESKDKTLRERRGRADKNIKEVDQYVPYSIPSNWKWIRLGEIGLFKKGPFGSALTKSMFVPKGVDTIKVYEQQHAIKKNADLGSYYITRTYFDDKMSGFEVKPGDILVSCAGTIGETYVMPDNIEQGIINQALMRVTLADGINKQFFQFYFDAYLKSSAKLGNGSAIINIPPFDIIKNWYFPLPPLAEQERIVNQLNELFAAMG